MMEESAINIIVSNAVEHFTKPGHLCGNVEMSIKFASKVLQTSKIFLEL